MALDQREWNQVRSALGADSRQLYELVTLEVTGEDGVTESVNSFRPVATASTSALEAFRLIEADVERMIQELLSLQLAERELRTALEEPGGAEMQRR